MALPQTSVDCDVCKRPRAADEETAATVSGDNGDSHAHRKKAKHTENVRRSSDLSPLRDGRRCDMSSRNLRSSSAHSSYSSSSLSSSFSSVSMLSSRSASASSASCEKRRDAQKQYPMFTALYAARFSRDPLPFLRVISDNSECAPVSPHGGSSPRVFVLYNEYRLLRELGKGTFAKVVLCSSLRTGETCALKIFRGESRYADACMDEVGVFAALCRSPQSFSVRGASFLRDSPGAACQGRLGRFIVPVAHLSHAAHHAIVLPALGPSLFDVLRKISRAGPRTKQSARESVLRRSGAVDVHYAGLPMELLRAVIFQVLLFLRHAHSRGIAHTDIKPENVLFETPDTAPVPLRIRTRRFARPPCGAHGKDKQTLHRDTNITAPLPVLNAVRVIDLGAAEFLDPCAHVSPVDKHTPVRFGGIQTTHYRSPEVLLDIGWNASADVWSLGCMIPELLTGSCVFMPKENIEHLALMQHIIGPFDGSGEKRDEASVVSRVFAHGRGFGKFFDTQTMRLRWPPPHLSEVAEKAQKDNSKKRRERRRRRREVKMEDVRYVLSQPTLNEILAPHPILLDLCRRMLDYDPLRRITAEDALRHPFFTSSQYGDTPA